MQTGTAESRRQPGLGGREESHGEPRGTPARARKSTEQESRRLKEKKKGRREEDRSQRDGGRNSRAADEGVPELGRPRLEIHQLQKEKLELMAAHNQETCRLQAELTRLRSQLERGEAQQVELQYQLSLHQRPSRERCSLAEQAAQLQQTVQELQKVLDLTQRAREEDCRVQQQEVEERDALIQNITSENQRLHQLLQDQEGALKELDQRIEEVQKETGVKREFTKELKHLREEEKRRTREKEASEEKISGLEMIVEAERSAHLETRFTCQLLQLRGEDLQAALELERSNQQGALHRAALLRAELREAERAVSQQREKNHGTERALERSEKELKQITSSLHREKSMTSDLTGKLEEEKRHHADTRQRWRQAVQMLADVREVLLQNSSSGSSPAKHDGSWSPAEVLQLLEATLGTSRTRLETASNQVQKLEEEKQSLHQLTTEQLGRLEESQQEVLRLQEGLAQLQQEASEWSAQIQGLQGQLERERQERTAEALKLTQEFQRESQARLSFLECVYQRLLARCVLLNQPQSMLGNFTWNELCDVINEQIDQLTSDLQNANEKVLQLQRSQEDVEEHMRRREETWSQQHTHTVAELQACRSECAAARRGASSLQRRLTSLTSDPCRRRGEAASFLCATGLLAGALRHAHRCLAMLRHQKAQLSRRLEEKEVLEEEVRRLAAALGGQEEQGGGALRRWRTAVWALLALHRWRQLSRHATVLFQVEAGRGGATVGICGGWSPKARAQVSARTAPPDRWEEFTCWLRSQRLSSAVLVSMAGLQGALEHPGSSPQHLTSACRSAVSRLLEHLVSQSEAEVTKLMDPPKSKPTLGSALQQHFLLFSQRLHSAEVERRSLRLELTNQKRGRKEEVLGAAELRREQEAEALLQEQTDQLPVLQRRANTHAAQHSGLTQALAAAQQEVRQKERSLRTLAQHLFAVQRDRKRLARRLRRLQGELSHAASCRSSLISSLKAAETTCQQVRESLIQSQHAAQLRPLRLPTLLGVKQAESMMGAACQSFFTSFSQLHHACVSRINWLQQEASASQSHVTSGFAPVLLSDCSSPAPSKEDPAPLSNLPESKKSEGGLNEGKQEVR
ncbi:coiled-coil domain-containing protein 171 isoform X2 [Takifugu rubripes]|uniref:coiled-coil domain-containing protein 171 isoform X2 n=1 Tax=Takifugu rubripes TaxID=31033 RepID=UPI0011454706|nr:coiled-coil domain-containing protein 171 isoform X2 [Takifugu rubripes]